MKHEDIAPGATIRITAEAGPAVRPMTARVIKVHSWEAWTGMAWLDIYEIDERGQAVEQRLAYVALAGIHPAPTQPPRPRNTGPAARLSTDFIRSNR